MAHIGKPGRISSYLGLSTRPIDPGLAAVPAERAAQDRRRCHAIAGAYALRRVPRPQLTLCAMGPVIVETIAAADRLAGEGFAAGIVCISSPDLLSIAMQARRGLGTASDGILDGVFPARRVADGYRRRRPPARNRLPRRCPQHPATHLGVTSFGQCGDIDALTDTTRSTRPPWSVPHSTSSTKRSRGTTPDSPIGQPSWANAAGAA
jgi:pyruvate dehydrogenase E1 component